MPTKKDDPNATLQELWNAGEQRAAPRLKACVHLGDIAQCRALLKQNPELLSPPTSFIRPIETTLLETALGLRQFALAIDLIEHGAWCPWRRNPRHGESPEEASMDHLVRGVSHHFKDASSLGLASAAIAASGRPAPSWEEWASLKIETGRYAEAMEICDLRGIAPKAADARAAARKALLAPGKSASRDDDFWLALDDAGQGPLMAQHHALWRILLATPESMEPDLRDHLWLRLARSDKWDDIEKLASAGHFPSTWLLARPSGQRPSSDNRAASATTDFGSLAGAAFCSGNVPLGKRICRIPQARQAMLDFPPSLEALVATPIAGLQAMAKLGVPIMEPGAGGQNLFHAWAAADRASLRNGWKSLGMLFPEAIRAQSSTGRTPIEMVRAGLARNFRQLEAFEAIVVQIEREDIANSSAPAAKAPRPRL